MNINWPPEERVEFNGIDPKQNGIVIKAVPGGRPEKGRENER